MIQAIVRRILESWRRDISGYSGCGIIVWWMIASMGTVNGDRGQAPTIKSSPRSKIVKPSSFGFNKELDRG